MLLSTMLTMGFANIPRSDKVTDGGDDAWFVTNSIVNAMGVADGVGSWRRMGINAGNCARCVMKVAKDDFLLAGAVAASVTMIAKSSEAGVISGSNFVIDLSAIWFPYE